MGKSFAVSFLGRTCLLLYDLHSSPSLRSRLARMSLLSILSNAVIGSDFLSHYGVSLFPAIAAFGVRHHGLEFTHFIALGDTYSVVVVGVGIRADLFCPIIILLLLRLLMSLL